MLPNKQWLFPRWEISSGQTTKPNVKSKYFYFCCSALNTCNLQLGYIANRQISVCMLLLVISAWDSIFIFLTQNFVMEFIYMYTSDFV